MNGVEARLLMEELIKQGWVVVCAAGNAAIRVSIVIGILRFTLTPDRRKKTRTPDWSERRLTNIRPFGASKRAYQM